MAPTHRLPEYCGLATGQTPQTGGTGEVPVSIGWAEWMHSVRYWFPRPAKLHFPKGKDYTASYLGFQKVSLAASQLRLVTPSHCSGGRRETTLFRRHHFQCPPSHSCSPAPLTCVTINHTQHFIPTCQEQHHLSVF
jgi:hypothetical protein